MSTLRQVSVGEGFQIDPRLLDKCIPLFQGSEISYLLHKNAHVLWIILVPHTRAEEFYQLSPGQLQFLCTEINRISHKIEGLFRCDRLHVTTIGNEVEQMHVHIVCSVKDDRFLPEEMWNRVVETEHSQSTVRRLAKIMQETGY